jgi:hypothetical protein
MMNIYLRRILTIIGIFFILIFIQMGIMIINAFNSFIPAVGTALPIIMIITNQVLISIFAYALYF